MSTVAFDVAAVRARFAALQRQTAFFDGPGGTQTPDSVIEAVASLPARGEREPRRPVRDEPPQRRSRRRRARGGGALPRGLDPGGRLRPEHDDAQLRADANRWAASSRPATRSSSRGSTTTPTSPPGSSSPTISTSSCAMPTSARMTARSTTPISRRRCLGADEGRRVPVGLERRRLDHRRARGSPSSRTRRARSPGSTPCTTPRTGRSTWRRRASTSCICSPYKFFGPHLGLFFGKREVLDRWRPYKVRPSANEPVGHRFETGTLAHELLAGCTAAVEYVESIGWDAIVAWERELGQRFLDGLPEAYRCTESAPWKAGRPPSR